MTTTTTAPNERETTAGRSTRTLPPVAFDHQRSNSMADCEDERFDEAFSGQLTTNPLGTYQPSPIRVDAPVEARPRKPVFAVEDGEDTQRALLRFIRATIAHRKYTCSGYSCSCDMRGSASEGDTEYWSVCIAAYDTDHCVTLSGSGATAMEALEQAGLIDRRPVDTEPNPFDWNPHDLCDGNPGAKPFGFPVETEARLQTDAPPKVVPVSEPYFVNQGKVDERGGE